ncbi:DNA helicase INO80 [Mytilus galloprovincialis]|uniref:Chromatin-remodeling ATPase INO80 n=1 Tax=Mytilus galloprovincialis TaxID=29158 RepID=A0A8B6FR02_MYTGA|nr:DNA helicase INO80 [Mytilus galloprovincialis]VDI53954.1 DNA helicase INO80 [Mytilus galloprovincialis]
MLQHSTSLEHNYGQLAKPLHVQQVEQALRLEPFLNYVEDVINKPPANSECDSTDSDYDVLQPMVKDSEGSKILNGVTITKAERKADKTRLYNFSKVKKSRRWLRNILLSDSSSDEDEEKAITNEDLQTMLKIHKYQRKHQMLFYQDNEHHQHQYYSTGLLSNYDKYHDHQKHFLGPKKKIAKEQRKQEKKLKVKLKKLKKERLSPDSSQEDEIDPSILEAILAHRRNEARGEKKLSPEQADIKRKKLWITIAKKEIPKAQKQKVAARKEVLQSLKKVSQQCMREVRKAAIQSQKTMKEQQSRARRMTREMVTYWKRFEKVEKEHRKKAEKEALEQRKMDLELREARRQQRKLNFLITQTELYAHFMAKKMTGESEERQNEILHQLDETKPAGQVTVSGGVLTDSACDDYDSDRMKDVALRNAEDAYSKHQAKNSMFRPESVTASMESSFANPSISTDADRPQPSIFEGTLKPYQLKGMNWLANLYDQGINGILADEMGLGKTVQSIALLGHLAENQGIWGPFLVIAPASTLHNWQQEVSRFFPRFKVVPYWGNSQDRRVLRKFWDSQNLHQEEASFHVVITSYQLVIQDVKYFQRIKWQYMILDEAQAIKSSSSVRWKILLGFNCRNRLLLTGTPIQNSMAELWALLHFIMPTMFDSHEEFNEWFSKDIESHAEKQSGIDENQLSRLRMILQPFMLRRVKKDVENELSDKIEILVYCPLTTRQRMLYKGIKNKISIEDLLSSSSSSSSAQNSASSLMNIVMQFRKVCNHSELFERREVKSPFFMKREPFTIPKLVYRNCVQDLNVSSKQKILYNMFYVFSPENIHQSMCSDCSSTVVNSLFSFTKFIDISPKELHNYMFGGLLVRWLGIFLMMKMAYSIHHHRTWHKEDQSKYLNRRSFLLYTDKPLSFTNVNNSPVLSELVFTNYTSNFFGYENHTLHCMKETQEHCKLRHRNQKKKTPFSPPHSPTKSPSHHPLPHEIPHHHKYRPPRELKCQPTELPPYMYYTMPKVNVNAPSWECHDRSAAWQIMKENLCGTLEARQSLLYGTPEIYTGVRWWNPWYFSKVQPGGLLGVRPKHGMSGVYCPDKESLVTDAGKLFVLDTLLQRLKSEGHRVLIYSQMTKMIDLLEEYMWHRKHIYIRLDGSSKISERRDMVADFQSRNDIFVFLLSTRAGGLGINLTAADTVIFYDSDWNPTVDQQAMDRAHRLGQTKQVTVYRLICKGTIEERILQRAKEKSEIQRMVISGGTYRQDVLKPKEVVSLLIDDEEMERKILQKTDEKGPSKDEGGKEKEKKRKREYVRKKDSKKVKQDENVTIPADTESMTSFDSMSVPASPQSGISYGSELTQQSGFGVDDSSNDALVIVDDPLLGGSTQALTPPTKKGKRGRPKGSTGTRRPRGRGLKKALSAAEIAGAQAGLTAAYAAYGYNFTGTGGSPSSKSNSSFMIGDSPKNTNSPQDSKKQ